MAKAANGPETACHEAATGRACAHPARRSRRAGENAHSQTASGRPSTRSGAAKRISTSCCTMWAENSTPPRASSGEMRAMKSASHPAAKHAASHFRTPCPAPARRQSARTPRP